MHGLEVNILTQRQAEVNSLDSLVAIHRPRPVRRKVQRLGDAHFPQELERSDAGPKEAVRRRPRPPHPIHSARKQALVTPSQVGRSQKVHVVAQQHNARPGHLQCRADLAQDIPNLGAVILAGYARAGEPRWRIAAHDHPVNAQVLARRSDGVAQFLAVPRGAAAYGIDDVHYFSVTSFTLHQLPLAVVQVMRSLVVVTVLHVAALVTPPVYDPSFTHADPLHRSTVYVRG